VLCALDARPDTWVVAPCAWAVMLIATSKAGTMISVPRKTRMFLM
jgi:hypothetical protein